MKYSDIQNMRKQAMVDADTLRHAQNIVRLSTFMSVPLTAPVGLLAAALTPRWTDKNVLGLANNGRLANLRDLYIPGKGYYQAAKLDAYLKNGGPEDEEEQK